MYRRNVRRSTVWHLKATVDGLVDMLHHWHIAVVSGQSVRIVFIDFAKAFDRVDHNVLMSKMMALNLPEIIIRWMYSYLLHRHERVKIGNVLSDCLHLRATSTPSCLTR